MVNESSERLFDYDFIARMLPETDRAIDWLVKVLTNTKAEQLIINGGRVRYA